MPPHYTSSNFKIVRNAIFKEKHIAKSRNFRGGLKSRFNYHLKRNWALRSTLKIASLGLYSATYPRYDKMEKDNLYKSTESLSYRINYLL